MSHRWDCPSDWRARQEGERAYNRGLSERRNPYDDPFGRSCEDAERAWKQGYRDAERREEYRREEERREEAAEARRAAARREEEMRLEWAREEERRSENDFEEAGPIPPEPEGGAP